MSLEHTTIEEKTFTEQAMRTAFHLGFCDRHVQGGQEEYGYGRFYKTFEELLAVGLDPEKDIQKERDTK